MADDVTMPSAAETKASDNRKMAKAAAGISVLTAAGFLTGLVTKMILSRLLGTEATANAYNYVFRLTQDIFRTWDKLIRPSFLPVLAHERDRTGRDDSAWHFINSITNAQAILFAVGTAALMVFSRQIVGAITDFHGEELRLSSRYLVVMAPSVFFLALAVTGYMLLNSYKRFQLAAFGDQVFVKLAPFLALILLWWFLGIYALILAVVFGAAAKLALYAWGLRRELRNFLFELKFNTPAMRTFGILILPLIAGTVVAFLRNRGEDTLLSAVLGGRAMTIVTYSRTPVDIPIQLLPVALSIAIFPFLSEYFVKRQTEQLFEILGKAVRIIFLVFLPLTVMLMLLAHPIVDVMFGGGKFKAEDVRFTTQAVQCYAFGYVFLALEIVLLQFFYAARETWTPTWTGIVTSIVQLHVLALIILWAPLRLDGPKDLSPLLLQIGAFNLAFSISKVIKVLLLVVLLIRVYPHAHLWWAMLRRTLPGLAKVVVITVAMGAAVYFLGKVLPAGRSVKGMVDLAVLCAVAGVIFAALAHLMRVEEWHDALGWVKRKLKRS